MPRMSLADAATLAEASYSTAGIRSPRVLASCPDRDVQGHMLDGSILLLPGSNSVKDYLRFNLRILNLGNKRLTLNEGQTEKGASGTIWHQGFLAYSRVLFDWLASINARPKLIIGHSLGAAAAQVLCRSYGVPTVAFAAPRPKFVKGPVKHDEKLLIINRIDDLVPNVPPGFTHMGRARRVAPQVRRAFPAHSMKHYRSILGEGPTAAALPGHWG